MYQKCLHVYFTGIQYHKLHIFSQQELLNVIPLLIVLFIECVIYVCTPFIEGGYGHKST